MGIGTDIIHNNQTTQSRPPWKDIHGKDIEDSPTPEPVMVYPQVVGREYDIDPRLELLVEKHGRLEGEDRDEVVYSAPADAFSRDRDDLKKLKKNDLQMLVDEHRISHYGTGSNGAVLKIDLIDALSNA